MAKILLIEPDRMLSETYVQALVGAGNQVRVARTAQAAIHAADELAPDVVVLELQLVAHSGIEFLYELRSYADWQKIPVIILSHVPPQEFNQSIDALKNRLGVRAYLYKPATNLKTLLRAVEAVAAPV
ncbi:MAG TPA: response regulator [Candidatus Saccharimonadales bacterium]|jgi:DNA-binding response OmpR family regulator